MDISLEEIAKLTGTRLVGSPHHSISNVADLESATEADASFLANPRYEHVMRSSQAGAIFIHHSAALLEGKNFLLAEDPSLAFQKLVDHFYKDALELSGFAGIHPSAVIHPSATVGDQVVIGPHAVIEKNVIIGNRSRIGANVFIGPASRIGQDCLIHPNVTIRERSKIGDRVILQPGCVIGSCGFGYSTNQFGKHTKLNQVGTVVIEDDVEIGANSTIDRSRFKETRIKQGTKIDNLVQIGHGALIGEHNMIVAQVGIAGSSETGRNVVLGGQVGVAGHIKLGNGVMVAASSGVSKSLPQAGKYNGVPAMPLQEYNRNAVYLRNIDKYIDQIKALEKRLNEIDKSLQKSPK